MVCQQLIDWRVIEIEALVLFQERKKELFVTYLLQLTFERMVPLNLLFLILLEVPLSIELHS
jgi:hypothetical protein